MKLSKTILSSPIHFIAFGFGSGLSPIAPGTVGTLAAIPLYLVLAQLSLPVYLMLLLVAAISGIWVCGASSQALGVHDHGGIVWDEFVGFWITMMAAPTGWYWIAIGFVLFRVFDICKPWPIAWADQQVHGGMGIMLDDILAGLYALLLMQLLAYWVASG
ncbi:MAG: phosphatidylglycerophosphatase A [Proteobacteria bacterium]|nr:MAG: phosphatidylglycerophosphatase A [Pseudomonadota bacterium]